MRRTDWTPLVLITASISVTVVAAVLLTTPWLRLPFQAEPGPTQARRHLAARVDVWVGEVAPDVTGLLGPVWGATEPDRDHDARLNAQLGLADDATLAWYHLLLFNRSREERTVALADGALRIRPREGQAVALLRSLPGLVARGEAVVPPALETVLGARGALSESVDVPGGWMADLLVAFDRRVDLGEAVEVAWASGEAFHRRPMTRRELEDLVADPEAARIEDL